MNKDHLVQFIGTGRQELTSLEVQVGVNSNNQEQYLSTHISLLSVDKRIVFHFPPLKKAIFYISKFSLLPSY